jgi:hypothetical protein
MLQANLFTLTSIGNAVKRLLNKIPNVRALRRRLKSPMLKWSNRTWRRQLKAVQHLDALAVVIVMPGSVHVGALALNYLREYENVLCISNGLADWEYEILQRCHFTAVVKTRCILVHAEVIDGLIEVLDKPFWLIDHDCYVLDIQALHQQRQKLGERAGLAFYNTKNLVNGIVAPETFLILLNPKIIRGLQNKYRVKSSVYLWAALPDKVKAKLELVGAGDDRRPEDHKPCFDTLRVIALLAQAEGCGFIMEHGYSAVCQPYPEVIHIGGIGWRSGPLWPPPNGYSALGTYFWRRCLENSRFDKMQNEYGRKWLHVPDSQQIRQHILSSGLLIPGNSSELLDFLDHLVAQSLPKKPSSTSQMELTRLPSGAGSDKLPAI